MCYFPYNSPGFFLSSSHWRSAYNFEIKSVRVYKIRWTSSDWNSSRIQDCINKLSDRPHHVVLLVPIVWIELSEWRGWRNKKLMWNARQEWEIFYLFCSLASDRLYTVAINQTIISVSNKKTSSCETASPRSRDETRSVNPLVRKKVDGLPKIKMVQIPDPF